MNISACIYDLDGVVVDTTKFHFEGWQWIAEELGYKLSEKQFLKIKDLSDREAIDRLLKWSYSRISEADKQHYLSELNKRFLSDLDKLSSEDLFAGFKQFNSGLRQKGIKTALLSTDSYLIRIMDKLDLILDFDAIIDAGMVDDSNYSMLLQSSLAKLNAKAGETIFITSASKGVEAANKLHLQSFIYGIGSADTQASVSIDNWDTAQKSFEHEITA